MSRALVLCGLLALACGTNLPTSPLGEFTAPGGVAATGAGDRDVVFIANPGRNGLRALQLCNHALLPDGGIDPADTCPTNVDRQFVPAPIRVFPATVETGGRPLRVAGARLSRADGSAGGVGLSAGGDATVALIDARGLVDTQSGGGIPDAGFIQHTVDLGARTIDVIAVNPMDDRDIEVAAPPGSTVPAFVATETELIVLDVGLDASGVPQYSIRSRCTLTPVLPEKLATAPGIPDTVYVADGAGDGVVAIATASIAGGACTMDRISAGGRSVRSVSVSPKWYEPTTDVNGNAATIEHPAGEFLALVVDPATAAQPGRELDPGGLLIAQTGLGGAPKGIVPIPPFPFTDSTSERMQPLGLGTSGPPATPSNAGLLREVAFLRAVKPRPSPVAPDLKTCTAPPCTPLYVGQPANAPTHLFNLLAAVSATDGGTYFIDVLNRRFVNINLYAATGDASIVPAIAQAVAFSPAVTSPPTLSIDLATLEPGVTHTTFWRAIWHSPIPGLDHRGGTLAPTGTGTLRFTAPQVDFSPWQNDPAIQLAAGDVISFGAFYLGSDGSAGCQALAAETPFRVELPIVSIATNSLELAELADTPDLRGFHPDCSSIGAVAEVRAAGAQPWLVFEGNTVQGRVQPDGSYVARQRRFDYPRSTYTGTQAAAVNDVAFKFTITGPAPATPRSGFSWSTTTGQLFAGFADSIAVSGLATAVYAYSSPRAQSLVFTSITGSNEVLQADPSLLTSNLTLGFVAYR